MKPKALEFIKESVQGIIEVEEKPNGNIRVVTKNVFVDTKRLKQWESGTGASNIEVLEPHDSKQFGLIYEFYS